MPKADRIIRLMMTLAVIAVAAVAGIVSYKHAYEVAIRWGAEDNFTAMILPVSVDGLIVAGSLTGLFCSRYGLDKPKLARTALLTGIVATLVTNVAHGVAHGLPAAVIAGWPAVAFLVSSELLLWVVAASRGLDRRAVVVVEPAAEEEQDPQLVEIVRMLGADQQLTAKAVSRSLGLPYERARLLTKHARSLVNTAL